MNAWIKDGIAPPASIYPKVSADQTVAPGVVQFPKIPGVHFPTRTQHAWRADYGPGFAAGIVTREPPSSVRPSPRWSRRWTRTATNFGGIRMPEVQAPLVTYTGWNLRASGIGASEEMFSMQDRGCGLRVPARIANNRRSAPVHRRERYKGREDYQKFWAAGKSLIAAGFLPEGDLPQLLRRGAAEWDHLNR